MKVPFLLIATLACLVALEVTLRFLVPSKELWLDLPYPPQSDRALIIGNSMFKTGVDPELFEGAAGEPVDFNYYDGYYTNLWFLIFKNAIIEADEQPKALIWGFRPNYAIIPAFRQRKAGHIEHFRAADEPLYEAISASTELPWTERVDLFLDNSVLYSLRDEARDSLLESSKALGIRGLGLMNERYRNDTLITAIRASSVGDLLLAAVTENQVQMSEELVADVAGPQDSRFITGERSTFSESFVPHIGEILKDANIPQLVVIFKPVTEMDGTTREDVHQFKQAAVEFFRENDIPVANVFDDLELTPEDYGSGDHYNSSGRAKVTNYVATRYREQLRD